MRFTVIFFFAGCLQISARTLAQNISLSEKAAPLKSILKKITSQSGVAFFYDEDLLKKSHPVDVVVAKASLKEVLAMVFRDQSITYEIVSSKLVTLKERVPDQEQSLPAQGSAPPADTSITGKVTNENGDPLDGVTVTVKGTGYSVTTNKDGEFLLRGSEGKDSILFSYVGYSDVRYRLRPGKAINISMKPNIALSEDVVVVGYGTQKKVNLTGAVSSVRSEELTKAPVGSTINTLAGRLPGLISYQTSGQPGSDQAGINIRGFGQALWIVDGVESDFNNIDPNEIESVSILKDGSASIYGARAGNGVILVTTKRGLNQKPVINVNSSYTLQGITSMTKPVSSGQYAELQNEKFINQGLTAPYTEEQVQKYYNGTDPQYPNTNWFNETIRNWAPQQQHNVSVRGGSDKIRYYGFVGYLDQEALWRSNGGNYGRYNVQSNIDAKIADNLTVQLNLSSIIETRKFSNRGQGPGINTLWQDLWNSLPIYPATLPDPTKYSYANGQGVGSIKLISDYKIAGYDENTNQNLKGTFVADYKFKPVRGLSAKLFFNYQQNYQSDKNFTKPYDFYTYDVTSNTYTLAGSLGTQARLVLQDNNNRTLTGQLSLSYDRAFGDHHITALALYEAIDYKTTSLLAGRDNFLTPAIEQLYAGAVQTSQATGSATEMGRASYVGRINYSYAGKYLLEATLRADASAKFPPARRWGYFPGVSVGWRLNQERFMQNITAIDELKIRASYGSSGLDDVGNFQYLSGYKFDGQWLIGPSTQVGLVSTGLANPNLTWETIKIYNGGVDFSLWKRKIFGGLEVFYRELNGIPATRILSLSNTFGATLPAENLNSQNNRGFELTLGTSGKTGRLVYEVSGNLSWSRSKWDHYEEQDYTDPDQIRILKQSGKWTDNSYGYRSDGLFTSQDEISKLAFTYPAGNAGLRPGDIKYVDVNKDGKLDWRDQVNIGKGTAPHWMAGLNVNLRYKSFDLSTLFQGAFGYYNYIQLQHGGINYSEVFYKLHWSEKNNSANAFVPRLGGSSSNDMTSDHFYKKAGYVRLKTLAVGYRIPRQVMERIGLQELRVYFAATNLWTFNKLKDYDVDPEAPSGNAGYYYPQQRTITFGLNLSF
ncbi:MAG TPA: TonB-dependent receptor [Puia sp.]|nr:TonB-dependent receptor [Puia sp.]